MSDRETSDDEPAASDDKPEAGDDKPEAGDDKPEAGDDKPEAGDEAAPPAPKKGRRRASKNKKATAGPSDGAPPHAEGGAPRPAAGGWKPVGALPARIAYPLAVLSGLLYFIAFPGVDAWPVSLVALAPLIVAMHGQPTRRAAGLGWTAGFTMTMTGFYWLMEMLKVFSGFPTALCLVFMAILCAYQGGRIALCGWLYGRATTRGWPAPLVFAMAFAASELLYPLLFPWYFGASVHNAPALLQVSDLGGPILVGIVLVASNLAVAELVLAWRHRRPVVRRLVAVGVAVPVVAALYGFVRIRSVDAASAAAPAMKIGVVQGNMPLFDRKLSIPVHVALTKDLRERGADLVIWSEAAATRTFSEAKYADEVYKVLTKDLAVPTVVGTVLHRPGKRDALPDDPDARGRHFNTALMADGAGKIVGRYDKQFLLMFGEYLPLGDVLPILYKWSPNSGRFSPGETVDPLPLGDHRISALICYEDILPSFVNKVVRHGDPDLLVNLTNDAWFGDSTEPWIHLALAKLRAVEHRRFLVRATNSGVSAIIDPVGRLVPVTVTDAGGAQHAQSSSTPFTTQTLLGEGRWMRAWTLYAAIGDVPWWIAAVILGFMASRSRAARRPSLDSRPKS